MADAFSINKKSDASAGEKEESYQLKFSVLFFFFFKHINRNSPLLDFIFSSTHRFSSLLGR